MLLLLSVVEKVSVESLDNKYHFLWRNDIFAALETNSCYTTVISNYKYKEKYNIALIYEEIRLNKNNLKQLPPYLSAKVSNIRNTSRLVSRLSVLQ